MPVVLPALADPQIAVATFASHLDSLWATGHPAQAGWERTVLTPMCTIVSLPGVRPDGARDSYFIKLGAEYYDAAPPTATFVDPASWSDATEPSRWYPLIENKPGWFGLHNAYKFLDGTTRQLICCSIVAQYYMTDHSPTETQRWRQGQHTVAATLYRLAEVLGPRYYRKPTA